MKNSKSYTRNHSYLTAHSLVDKDSSLTSSEKRELHREITEESREERDYRDSQNDNSPLSEC